MEDSAPNPCVISVRVYGYPIAQGRPRAARVGGFIKVYDPETSRDWKRTIQAQVLPAKPPALLEGPLGVHFQFFLPRPTSLPKRVARPTKRPDLSNLVKAVEDAICGIIYRDDSQIVDLTVTKEYSPQPGVLIRVELIP